jgi:hypothetical protein
MCIDAVMITTDNGNEETLLRDSPPTILKSLMQCSRCLRLINLMHVYRIHGVRVL